MPEKPKKATASPDALRAEVEAWFIDTFHNHGPALTEVQFNHFRAAKDKLIERLHALTEKEG